MNKSFVIRYCCIVLFFGSTTHLPLAVMANTVISSNSPQTNGQAEEEKTIFNCGLNTDADINAELDNMERFFPKQYGALATDSIHAVAERARQLLKQNNLLVKANEIKFKPANTTYKQWLAQVFAGAKNAADSIELLCKWIPANIPLGESDPRFETMPTDSLYNLIRLGEITGGTGSYVSFLSRLVLANNSVWQWGTPVVFNGLADTAITKGAKAPSHIWLGFAKPNGQVWCLADPTIGGLVRDTKTQHPLPLDSVTVFLRSDEKAGRVYVTPVAVSLQATGPCLLSIQFRNNNKLDGYKIKTTGQWVTRGPWYTWGEKGSMAHSLFGSYWAAEAFPLSVPYNIYCKINSAIILTNEATITTAVSKRYNLPAE